MTIQFGGAARNSPTYGKAQKKESSREFVTILEKKNPPPFRSKFQVFDSETHGSLPLVSLYNGLLFIFDGFHPNLNQFVEEPSSIAKHYFNFSRSLGIEFLPPEDLIHDVCTHTVNERPNKAIECFQINVKNYPRSINALNTLGSIYLTKGMKSKARETFETSLMMQSNNPVAKKSLQKINK